jgi:hypothetical protein
VLLVFAVRLVNPFDGPIGEEPGWRGFAQPRLQSRRSPLIATLILGLLVVVWHVPLLLPEYGLRPIDLVTTFGVTIFYAWLFNHAGGSVLITIVAHAAEGSIKIGQFHTSGAAEERANLLYAVVWSAVAIGLIVLDWRFWQRTSPEAARTREDERGPAPTTPRFSACVQGALIDPHLSAPDWASNPKFPTNEPTKRECW